MPGNEKEAEFLEEIKRNNQVLMEHMEHQVKTVAEQHGSIKAEIHQLRNYMDGRFDSLETTIGAVLSDHEKRIQKL